MSVETPSVSGDSSDSDLDAAAAAGGLGSCVGTGNITTGYATGKVAFYDSGRVLLWRGPGDVTEISTEVMQEAGGGETSYDLQTYAIAALTANGTLQKYGDW